MLSHADDQTNGDEERFHGRQTHKRRWKGNLLNNGKEHTASVCDGRGYRAGCYRYMRAVNVSLN